MRVVRVVGPSGAGKTTLVESLVPVLGAHGRVATVKSIHHDVEVDASGKDTHRHRTAGADRVVGVAPSQTFSVVPRGKRDHPDGEAGALADVLGELSGYAFVIVEGFGDASLPAIVVGTPDPGSVAGEVLVRVADPGEADVAALAERIRALPAAGPAPEDV